MTLGVIMGYFRWIIYFDAKRSFIRRIRVGSKIFGLSMAGASPDGNLLEN